MGRTLKQKSAKAWVASSSGPLLGSSQSVASKHLQQALGEHWLYLLWAMGNQGAVLQTGPPEGSSHPLQQKIWQGLSAG